METDMWRQKWNKKELRRQHLWKIFYVCAWCVFEMHTPVSTKQSQGRETVCEAAAGSRVGMYLTYQNYYSEYIVTVFVRKYTQVYWSCKCLLQFESHIISVSSQCPPVISPLTSSFLLFTYFDCHLQDTILMRDLQQFPVRIVSWLSFNLRDTA